MIVELGKSGEICVFRRSVPLTGLFAASFLAGWIFVLSAAPARAQVNIDQGKSTAEIFSNDCGTCHKTAKGLANGKNSATLAGFLREHYTSSAQQAASLAAYVLGAGSGPPPSANLKPGTAGESKAGEAKIGDAKPGEKPGDKAGARQGRPDSSTAKLQPPTGQDTKIEAEPAAEPSAAAPNPAAPGRNKPAGKREPRPVTASRGPRQEPETPPPVPQAAPIATPDMAPVATAPAATTPAASPAATEPAAPPAEPPPAATAAVPSAAPESGPAPSAAMSTPDAGVSASSAAPAEAPPSDSAPVPRDDIPD
jgi:hypothetical protein